MEWALESSSPLVRGLSLMAYRDMLGHSSRYSACNLFAFKYSELKSFR